MKEMWLYCKYVALLQQAELLEKGGEIVSISKADLLELTRKVAMLQYQAFEEARKIGMRYNIFLKVFEVY